MLVPYLHRAAGGTVELQPVKTLLLLVSGMVVAHFMFRKHPNTSDLDAAETARLLSKSSTNIKHTSKSVLCGACEAEQTEVSSAGATDPCTPSCTFMTAMALHTQSDSESAVEAVSGPLEHWGSFGQTSSRASGTLQSSCSLDKVLNMEEAGPGSAGVPVSLRDTCRALAAENLAARGGELLPWKYVSPVSSCSCF